MIELIPIRLSHLLRHCSVGAVVRGPDYLMTVKDIREWTDRSGKIAAPLIRYVERVRSALGIEQELREPPLAQKLEDGRVDGVCVPAMRFPGWMRCPKCGLMYYKPWLEMEGDHRPHCLRCDKRPRLEQVQWILVHAAGHLAEVPWHYLAHQDAKTPTQKQCRAVWRGPPYIRLIEGIKRQLRCETCKATRQFWEGKQNPPLKIDRQQPWLKSSPDSPAGDEGLAEVMGVNDVRVHYPVTKNALVIPPESRIRQGTVVDRLYSSSDQRRQIDQAVTPQAKKGRFKSLAAELRCTPEDIDQAWSAIEQGYPLYGASITKGLLLESEYQAFIEEMVDVSDDEDFVTQHQTGAWKHLMKELPADSKPQRINKLVSRLVVVTRLREIQIFTGFCRVALTKETLVPPDIDGKSEWLPAIELYGEGIFISLDETILNQWEDQWEKLPRPQELIRIFRRRFEGAPIRFASELTVTPRFLLLHTLAHILIRQLETVAGYPAASLKERIYCAVGKEPMAGILIYVAVPDVVGSLGGLAELAEPRRFLKLLTGVFHHAEWCSLDPVCSEHEGQGPQLLNRAACHACALIPEPSCAYGNALLDRTFIKGDIAGEIPGILDCV